ncbi:MAG TPA: AraC family transcriptional regulator [Polyangiaceae bacterium]|nr:AraC family transcriptional regulator [Polyangiaceae bacterium]
MPPGFPALPLLVPPLMVSAFEELGVGLSSFGTSGWRALHQEPGISVIENEHGGDQQRYRYNLRCFEQARATRQLVRGELMGLCDLFVPVVRANQVEVVLVTGPFARKWPSSEELLERWFQLTRSRGRLSDPGFSRYLEATLATLTLEGALPDAFERLVSCFARLIGEQSNLAVVVSEAERLRLKLLEARHASRMWAAARSMVDERTARSWSTFLQGDPLKELGMKRPPKHVVVGLLLSHRYETNPVGEALARAAFQRACVTFVQRSGHVVCGQVGDRGVVLLPDFSESGARARTALVDLAMRIATLARRFGFRLHAGVAAKTRTGALPTRYRAALAAAEKALSRGAALEVAEDRAEPSREGLRHLRASLATSVEGEPGHLSLRFGRYVEAVLAHSGYQLETSRGHLQAGVERLAEPLLATGVLDPKSFDEILSSVERERGADTVVELTRDYRRIVSDIERAVHAPTTERHERSTRRALAFIHEHSAEPLTRARVARVAGFAPSYFSRLLKKEEGLSFESYLQKHRLERAKQLLRGTRLSSERVAQLSGFRSRTSFQRLFKQATGTTPMAYRKP